MSSENASRDLRLQEILAGYLQAVEAGKNPSREQLLAQHPDLAEELRAFLDEHDRMQRLVQQNEAQTIGSQGPARSSETPTVGTMVRYFGDYRAGSGNRPRRHGRGLQGQAGEPQSHRGRQNDPERPACQRGGCQTFLRGGGSSRRPAPSQHRRHSRSRRARGPALFFDGLCRGPEPGCRCSGASAGAAAGGTLRAADCRGDSACSRQGHFAPRPQAFQCVD